ncbi:cytochrome P450 [Zopfia rhizophila CBS 207.26]|uniref:Cytochrome P450 n=1 Tax=Zopfia rhizophila CBS 207.26 TaxID=1314779 RepID=A0A6A6E3P1_9PEZI|nr:cytochrome P450 [Zopfia rhizophila CBS 207.26]
MALSSLLLKAFGLGTILLLSQYMLPSPFLAIFPNLWRFFNHYSRQHIETQRRLHKKYGDAVQIGPHTVSLSDASLSDYYAINDALQDGHIIQNIFSTRSNEFHSKQLKPVQKLYTFQSAVELEPLMNNTLQTLCSQLETRFIEGANAGKTCDIADWISYFTWDFLGDMTFSKRMGFMEQGKDVGNMISTAEDVMRYFSVLTLDRVGEIPVLDRLLEKNPYLPYKFPDFAIAAGFCIQQFMARVQNLEQYKEKDFMNGFLAAKKEYPELVDDNTVIGYLIINIRFLTHHSYTTAIVIKAIFYWILKNPAVKDKLVAELTSANLPFPAAYATAEQLPYLDACIKEGLRIHPVVGHILERVVPSSGLRLSDGTVLPPGTIVGINPWVLTRNKDIYGERPDGFVPERWLKKDGENAGAYEARLRKMKDADMAFGSGNRTCLGCPLALVELYKVTATLFGKYQMDLEDQTKEWELHKQWFV